MKIIQISHHRNTRVWTEEYKKHRTRMKNLRNARNGVMEIKRTGTMAHRNTRIGIEERGNF